MQGWKQYCVLNCYEYFWTVTPVEFRVACGL
jgi:hypothetical protein